MAKYEYFIYNISSFCVVSNINLNLITCKDKIFIPLVIQSYVLNWYHKYILRPVMDIIE